MRTTKTVRATTLTATSAEVKRALSFVPMISKPVTSSEMTTAGRLMNPPWLGPTASAVGKSTPQLLSNPTK